jgi:HEAT repeat protein
MDLKLKKQTARKARGEVTIEFTEQFEICTDQDLLALLNNDDSQVRTAAAKILGQRKTLAAIPDLCSRFSVEKALYARIAISNALSRIGVAALPELRKYIGKIGANQHQDLPSDIFKKWNYPCPRDIVIRSIIRMGAPALKELNECLQTSDETVLGEIIDAIGHISFYSHDQSSFDNLMTIFTKYPHHQVIVWKVIRALQAFPSEQTIHVLRHFLLDSDIPQHRWEAARSLSQIATETAMEYLKMAQYDPHAQVRAMVELSLKHIHDLKRNG